MSKSKCLVCPGVPNVKLTTLQMRLVQLLLASGQSGLRLFEICVMLDFPYDASSMVRAAQLADRLIVRGVVHRVSRGRYRMINLAADAPNRLLGKDARQDAIL